MWVETKEMGGWSRFMTWMGAIMSASGFTWCYLVILLFGGYYAQFSFLKPNQAPYIGVEALKAGFALGYLIIEMVAKKRLEKKISDIDCGESSLDAKFRRIDLNSALESVKTQEGIPFSVPRFAAINVDLPDLNIQVDADFTSRNQIIKRAHLPGYEKTTVMMATVLKKSMLRKACVFRSLFFCLPLGLLVLGFLIPKIGNNFDPFSILCFGLAGFGCFGCIGLWANNTFMPHTTWSISTRIGDVLPDTARTAVMDNKHLFDAMYLVAEVPEWDFKEQKHPRQLRGDPLIVGEKNKCYYLVHAFDLTDLENWLKSEFTV